jgi:multiple sugar transport system substrate-binding protein
VREHPTRFLAVASLLFAAALSACGGGSGGSKDGATTVTMWTRAATETASRRLVDAYNASHKNKVKLTVIPTDNYQPRVAAAAGARQLPDVFASDVVFVPKYTSQNLFLDITDKIAKLPYRSALAPSHMRLGTRDGRQYTVPHTIDSSVLFYNKVLYKKAGLDPDKPPTTLKEFAQQATAIREKLGGDTYGTFWGGSCGGCYVFTFWPSVWAAGGQVMNPDGTQSTTDSPPNQQVFQIYHDLWKNGVVEPSVKDEKGATWTGLFPKGNIGVMPMPSTTLGLMPDNEKVKVGVAPIPGPDGGQSTFVGGDSVGVSATSKHPDAAWDFLAWSVSDAAQVEVVAKSKDIVVRTDLAGNKYAQSDPRVVLINSLVAKGQTPYSVNFGPVYNDPNGPWLSVTRGAVFGSDVPGALRTGAQQLTKALQQQ